MTSLDQTSADGPGTASAWNRSGLTDPETATTLNLLDGLAARLRVAYEQGADPAALAIACRQPESEVRRLLQRAGADLLTGRRLCSASVHVVPQPSTEPSRELATQQDAGGQRELRRARRPTPSRRLSRLHPRTEPGAGTPTPGPGAQEPAPAATPCSTSESAATSAAAAISPSSSPSPSPSPSAMQTPMGILIGASPTYTEPPAQSESSSPRRVTARLIRVNRGTCLVVLPSWRDAIAVSVPTEQLLTATGLRLEELPTAQLTVLIAPGALHDRELAPHGWQAERRRSRGPIGNH